jgi:hypothetical protein
LLTVTSNKCSITIVYFRILFPLFKCFVYFRILFDRFFGERFDQSGSIPSWGGSDNYRNFG